MDNAIIGSVIVATISGLTTIITSCIQRKETRVSSSRESILQLILEDKINVSEGKLPNNKENILHEFDRYKQNGGNSYVGSKVDEYLEWYKSVENKFKER